MINIQTTYQIIIDESYFFYRVIDYINENKSDDKNFGKNLIPMHIYDEFLDEFISNNKTNKKRYLIEEAFSIKTLVEHNIVSLSDKIENITYVIISTHILEMFKNIFRQFNNPLTKTQYQEHIQLIRSKKEYFTTNINFIKSNKLIEEIDALKSFLERVSDTLRNSLSALKYEKNNLSKHITSRDNNDTKILKLKKVKELRRKYITPLFEFVNKKSLFRIELENLRYDLENKNKLYSTRRVIDYYLKNYLITAKEVSEVSSYFNNYIQQSENELFINMGSEQLFEQISDIVNSLSDGRKTKYKIWNKNNELLNINPIFKHIYNPNTGVNLKTNLINQNTFDMFHIIELENNSKNTHKLITKTFENIQYEKIKEAKELESIRKAIETDIIVLFNKEVKNINYEETEITDFILKFLENTEYEWHIGHFQFLVNRIVKNNINRDIFKVEDTELSKDGIKTKYYKFKLKEENGL